jgi:hypothetical protein
LGLRGYRVTEWRKLHNEELNDLCDKIKKNEMGEECSMCGEKER